MPMESRQGLHGLPSWKVSVPACCPQELGNLEVVEYADLQWGVAANAGAKALARLVVHCESGALCDQSSPTRPGWRCWNTGSSL